MNSPYIFVRPLWQSILGNTTLKEKAEFLLHFLN